jgi:hypothetical protein
MVADSFRTGIRTGLQLALACGTLLAAASAHAVLAGDVTVTLSAPGGATSNGGGFVDITPISLVQSVAPSAVINNVNGGNVGAFMLDGEFIQFVGNSIELQIAAGSESAGPPVVFTTGLLGSNGTHATYQFDNLSISGTAIVGVVAYSFDGFTTTGTSGLISPASAASFVHSIDPASVSVDLDTLVFAARTAGKIGNGAYNFVDVRIDLITSGVPEPATALMAFVGLGVLLLRGRR